MWRFDVRYSDLCARRSASLRSTGGGGLSPHSSPTSAATTSRAANPIAQLRMRAGAVIAPSVSYGHGLAPKQRSTGNSALPLDMLLVA